MLSWRVYTWVERKILRISNLSMDRLLLAADMVHYAYSKTTPEKSEI
ncbi:predicted protein [Botrytis cinerea T4]|uniref:Uncharacterized protein n=1 Tax=Botryotinia fuckeliana (strain T4) TaxID=999810 RepID=G2YCX4_BOTF4|nr:predicted protein [Botrytis cinerea T4]